MESDFFWIKTLLVAQMVIAAVILYEIRCFKEIFDNLFSPQEECEDDEEEENWHG